MTFSPELFLLIILVITQGVFLMIALSNYLAAPVIRPVAELPENPPALSLLVPARNEEENIAACLDSLSAIDYPAFEIIVLDDCSEDSTGEIAASFSERHDNLKVIRGDDLPPGWLGKNHACHHRLSREASHDLLLFIDADVRLSPGAVTAAVTMMRRYKTGLLSCFPRQRLRTPGEHLIVPVMNWFLLTMLSLPLVYLKNWRPFVAANGQFMLFDRKTYRAIGGHKAVAAEVVEDMELARRVKDQNIPMMTALGGREVSCLMYRGFGEALAGFSKNFYPGFNGPPAAFLVLICFLALLFTVPLFLWTADARLWVAAPPLLIHRLILARATGAPVLLSLLLHPLQMGVMVFTAVKSLAASRKGKNTWKGRKI